MALETMVDARTGRKCYLDHPEDLAAGRGAHLPAQPARRRFRRAWQREYFPAYELCDAYGLAIATPSAATREPTRHWAAEADDEYLVDLVEQVFERFGRKTNPLVLARRPLAGRNDGEPAPPDRLLRVAGRRLVESLGRADRPGGTSAQLRTPEERGRPGGHGAVLRRPPACSSRPTPPTADLSFIYATGEHEIASLPETSPWAERYGAGPRLAATGRGRRPARPDPRQPMGRQPDRSAGAGSRRRGRRRFTCTRMPAGDR